MNNRVRVVGGVLGLLGAGVMFVTSARVSADEPASSEPVHKEPAKSEPSDKPADKPAKETKPAETKPAETKPAETKPSEAEAKLVYVSMKTSKGEIVIELNNEKAPISVKNFLHYTDEKYYDGTIFHRVMSTFMIQGGGFTKDMIQKKPTADGIKNEWKNGLKNVRGSIAMARIGGDPSSGTCQFFINVVDNDMLDKPQPDGAGYAVFGKVVSGMDVVDAIKAVPVHAYSRQHTHVPTEAVVIESVKKLTDEEAKKYVK